ncbi:hypothetical protein NC651_040515 [Populus alba x Populus x berolinensis]|nr:hypothetical protein NC651_040515 [Populus alba x Populus x berolinensis]
MVRRGLNQRDLCATHSMLSTVFFTYAFLLCSSLLCCFARDTISLKQRDLRTISSARGETLVSAGQRFELGFYTPEQGSVYESYVAIWYHSSNPPIVVWVANQKSPLLDDGGLDEERGQFVISDGSIKHRTSGESSDFFRPERMPDVIEYFLSNFTSGESSFKSISASNSTSKLKGPNIALSDYNNTRIRLDFKGELQLWSYNTNWSKLWWEPRDRCSVFNACGNFSSCNLYNSLPCRCLPGFEPNPQENWREGVFSGGCIRSSAICGKHDTFLSLKMMRVGQPDTSFVVEDEKQCREKCLNKCQCRAHSFVKGGVNRDRQPSTTSCLIWMEDLKDLQEDYSDGGFDLFVRVTVADIDTRTFVIQEKDVDDCTNDGTIGQIPNFNTSFPFKVNTSKHWCEIDIGWEPPQEPVCSSSSDCDDWPNSTCNNVKGNGTARCLCNSNFWWDGMALNCVQGGSSRKKKLLSLVVGVTIASVIVLSSIFLYTSILMRKKAKRRESQQNTERNAAAWRLWREDKALDLMDETLREICNTNEFLRCVNVALLCVQDDPSDRPTTSNVVVMLSSETANLPVPKNPAFFIRRGLSGAASCSSKQGTGLSGTDSSSRKNQFVILNHFIKYWTSGESSDFLPYFLSNFTSEESSFKSISASNSTSKLKRPNLSLSDYNNTRIRLDFKGELQLWSYNTNWSKLWWEPRDRCSVFNACGNFSSCNLYNSLPCRCLPGFEPDPKENRRKGVFSGGCIRSSAVCGKHDTFLSLKMMRVGQPDTSFVVEDEKQCREECLDKCQCRAHSFVKGGVNRVRQPSSNSCLIWMEDLKDLQEDYSDGGLDLFVRVTVADIEPKAKSCEPCGINVIPYPLSTGSDCGDPMYFSFNCDNSTGKLSFKTHSGTYNVTTINQDTRTFVIREKDVADCKDGTIGQIPNFNTSFPFKMNNSKLRCDTEEGNFISTGSSQGLLEIDIGWEPPQEPVCSSSSDCDDWPNSTCNNVKGNGTARCLCNSNFWWDGMALNCVQGGSSRKKKLLSLMVGVTIAGVIVLSSIFLYTSILMRKKAKRRESQQNTERNAAAWRLWREDKALDLMDETLREICNTNEFLRCVNVALLCVQDDPSGRPTMSNVVVMLSSEAANLPVPKNPAFFIRRGLSGTASCSSKQGTGLFSTASSSSKQEINIDTTIASDEAIGSDLALTLCIMKLAVQPTVNVTV